MHLQILPYLACPACLPRDISLRLHEHKRHGDDLIRGELSCPRCSTRYLVKDGIAHLTTTQEMPLGEQIKYEQRSVRDRYLWIQYHDLLDYPTANSNFQSWNQFLPSPTNDGLALDTGCAVGRLTFEMGQRLPFAIGCDLSWQFIRTARSLRTHGFHSFELPLQGHTSTTVTIRLPEHWKRDAVEFIVADARRLPLHPGLVTTAVSLNLLDRIDYPLAHLHDVNRVMHHQKGTFLLASPWCWNEQASRPERWLGGTNGRESAMIVEEILMGRRGNLQPPWQLQTQGDLHWKIRHHERHYEELISQYFLAQRII